MHIKKRMDGNVIFFVYFALFVVVSTKACRTGAESFLRGGNILEVLDGGRPRNSGGPEGRTTGSSTKDWLWLKFFWGLPGVGNSTRSGRCGWSGKFLDPGPVLTREEPNGLRRWGSIVDSR